MCFHYLNQNSWNFFCSTLGVRYGREISASVVDCWKWSTVFRKNLEWKLWPEENVEKLVWNNKEISWSSGGRSGREHTNCEGLWSSVPGCFSPVLLFVTPWTPWILQAWISECVATCFSRGSSSPRDQTWVSCIAGRVLIIFWATRDYSTEVQNGEGMKMQGLQEGRVGKMQSTHTFTTASVLHFLPAPIPSLPLFLYLAVGVISEFCGSVSIWRLQFS